jgi:two-component system sensor histidine kinase YesM
MDCDDEILEFPIMKMALQPIVENAVYHGLENKRGKGSVYIQGSLVDNQTVYIRISDNGRGIPKDRLEQLMEMLDQENTNNANITLQRTSIGLINIHNRIKNLYGKQYGITVESTENSGTTVTLRLPKTGGNGNVQSDAD